MNPWDLIKQTLESKMTGEAYRNWISRTSFKSFAGDLITVAVPDEATRICMEDYAEPVLAASQERQLPFRRVVYEVGPAEPASTNGFAVPNGTGAYSFNANADSVFGPAAAQQMNDKHTFDNFVVGPCNQFAHAAAKAVATMPGKSYNPLFIYGGVGMGKTHLINAIGRSLVDNYASLRIVYTTTEKFMNSMISCIKVDRMAQFHQYYRSADILLIDDIHTLAGKERTQEEFFYTFNELYDHQKQIVISSDSSPKSIPNLVERLRSRFEWGLMVDVQPPDLETKMAILDRKADDLGIQLPEDVRIFVATKTKSNVRELEGALLRLIAYSDITGTPVTLSMAQQVLKHMIPGQSRTSIEMVVKAVADHFSIQPSFLKQKSNARNVTYPRQIAMYLVKELTHASLPEIGRHFGGKHHTTVLHSVQKIEQLRATDAELNRLLHSITDSLQ